MRHRIRPATLLAAVITLLTWAASPAAAGGAEPATPTGLVATNGSSSVGLTWRQPATGSRPTSFRVYEAGAVVARNTTTNATIPDLAFNTTHTYQVTAVDALGRESAPSAPTTRRVFIGGPFACGMTPPSGLAAVEVTASAVSLTWSNEQPSYDQAGTLVVLVDGVPTQDTNLDSARVGGLAPASTHSFQVARRDCVGGLHPGEAITVSTPNGPAARPPAPGEVTVGARTATSIALSWPRVPQAAGYAVYEGGTRVATSATPAVVVRGLWRDTSHEFTVAALGTAGGESGHTGPVRGTTQPCPDATVYPSAVNPPEALIATAQSPSSVALTWIQPYQATSFTVYRLGPDAPRPVVTTRVASAMLTGLPSGDTGTYAVVAQTGVCGPSELSAPVTVTTPVGPAERPSAPSGLWLVSSTPQGDFTGTITLSWSQPASADPVTGYRLYEGATVLAEAAGTGVTLRLRSGPTHAVAVVAVDAAGNESAPSNQLVFTVPFIPPP
ncbi:fibronectin type III domain-containing protein [Rhizomonospora bruguierae]|uniref:fibronectin type III domain-containing protein n=1 Tax=Rhizomonospora bruguierae TaxID=1581705 RepID=UPI001BCF1430|nr:hypothetical protein [Micromonospora sp. NBRC 107566]